MHVTTPRTLRNRIAIQFHSHKLQFDEVTEHDGIPTTTPARTLIDIAATEPELLEQAFNEAEYRRLHDHAGIDLLLSRSPSRRGATAIRALLARAEITREELEHRFRALVAEHHLPRPEFNANLELEPGRWIRPDCLWREPRLIVELDGRAAHTTASRFDSDRERDRLLAIAGWTVIRVTWRHLTTDAVRLAADVRKLLATPR